MNHIKRHYRNVSVILFSICVSACGGNEETQHSVTGTAWASCSPLDSFATRFEFPVENQQRLIFNLNRDVNALVGQWKIGDGDAVNGLSVFLCPIDSHNSCTQIQQGVFRVESRADKTINGNWQLVDPAAPLKNSIFKANLISVSQPICG